MDNVEATITNIEAPLIAYGWGRFARLYCWTEAYSAIKGLSWQDAIVRQ